jgi:hypothetical protein
MRWACLVMTEELEDSLVGVDFDVPLSHLPPSP